MINKEELIMMLTDELEKAKAWRDTSADRAAIQSVLDFGKMLLLVKGMPDICDDCHRMGFA